MSSTHGDAGAEILAGPDGKYLYISSRGSGVVVVYKVQDDNTLARLQEFKLAGTWPRSMAIKDQMMLVIDQYGDNVDRQVEEKKEISITDDILPSVLTRNGVLNLILVQGVLVRKK